MQCALTVLCGAFFAVLLLFRVNPSSQIDAIWPLKANCTFILFVIIQADKNYNAMLYTHMWCNLRAYRRARTFLSFVIAHGEVGNLMSRCTVVVFRNDYIDWINFYCMSVRRCFDLFSEECQVQVSTCAPLHWSCARLLVRNSKKYGMRPKQYRRVTLWGYIVYTRSVKPASCRVECSHWLCKTVICVPW